MFLNVRAFFACVFRGEGKKGRFYFYKAQGKRVQAPSSKKTNTPSR